MVWEVDLCYQSTLVKATNLGRALDRKTDLQKGKNWPRALPVESLALSPKPVLPKAYTSRGEEKNERLNQASTTGQALF